MKKIEKLYNAERGRALIPGTRRRSSPGSGTENCRPTSSRRPDLANPRSDLRRLIETPSNSNTGGERTMDISNGTVLAAAISRRLGVGLDTAEEMAQELIENEFDERNIKTLGAALDYIRGLDESAEG